MQSNYMQSNYKYIKYRTNSKNNFHAVVALYKLYKNGPFPDFEAAEHWYQFGLGITLGTYEHRLFVRRCSLA